MAETLDPALPADVLAAAERVLTLADGKGLSLATAESCTGGLLAALLTDVPGLGHVFERGFVVYSKDAKCELLGVERDSVERCGAVSEEVALAMARGALYFSQAEVSLAITGFAGPGDDGDEEGLVHFACARRDGWFKHHEAHFGPLGRQGIRIKALAVALDLMEKGLRH